jgi:uncharacterized protein (DUF58 family)
MRFLWFLCLIITSALIFFNFTNPFVWAMAAALFLMPLVSFILRLVATKYVSVSLRAPAGAVCVNDEFDVIVEFYNKSFLPVPMITAEAEIHSAYSQELQTASLSLAGKSGGQLIFRLKAPHCSVVEVSIRGVWSSSYSKGFYKSLKLSDGAVFIPIIPSGRQWCRDVPPLVNSPTERKIDEIIIQKRAQSGEFSGVRLFTDGDRESRIHWKLSAKSEELYVRDFNDEMTLTILLIVIPTDVTVTPPILTDRIFGDAGRFAAILTDEGINCSMILQGYDAAPRPVENRAQIDDVLSDMITLTFTKEANSGLAHIENASAFDFVLTVDPEEINFADK